MAPMNLRNSSDSTEIQDNSPPPEENVFHNPEPSNKPGNGLDYSSVSNLVRSIIEQAVEARASDIHIEPTETDIRLRLRIDGILQQAARLPGSLKNGIASRIKIISRLDIAEKRIPQDGRFQQTIGEKEIDIRVSTFPTVFGEKLVLRLLDRQGSLFRLEDLGFSGSLRHNITSMVSKSSGMVLVSGPTGCGKSTTLYALLSELNSSEKNIITLEDPVEYMLDGINQTTVNPKAGLTFPVGLRSILRQDPDIVMVGEIRDLETAQIAVRAAITGHLLLSTLHTNDAPTALTRLVDMGIEPYLVASSVTGIISQRLVRKICRDCIEAYHIPPAASERKLLGLNEEISFTAFQGKGCTTCGNTGFFGRVAVGEAVFISDTIRNMLMNKASAASMQAYLVEKEGFETILDNGIQKIRDGVTTISELRRCL